MPVLDLGAGSAEDFAKAGDVAGAIVLVHSQEMKTWADLFAEYVRNAGGIERGGQGKGAGDCVSIQPS